MDTVSRARHNLELRTDERAQRRRKQLDEDWRAQQQQQPEHYDAKLCTMKLA
jgi:hypothetical protein